MEWIIRNIEWLFSGIAVAIPLAVIGWLLGRRKTQSHAAPSLSSVNITSYNQTGGITAQTVNVSPPCRTLPLVESSKTALETYAGTSAYVHSYSDSHEVAAFTSQLLAVLSNAGWSARMSVPHTGDTSVSEVLIEVNAASRDMSAPIAAARQLSETLNTFQIHSKIDELRSAPLPPNAMYVRVGPIT